MRLYFSEHPRVFVVVDYSYALIVRHPNPRYKASELSSHRHVPHINHDRSKHKDATSKQFGENKVLVEFLNADSLNLSTFKDITPQKGSGCLLHGFLGFINLKGFTHLAFITRAIKVASPRLNESVYLIDDVEFYCLSSDKFDSWWSRAEEDVHSLIMEDHDGVQSGYPGASVRRLLSLGCFYFSKDFNLASNLQERGHERMPFSEDQFHERFVWNSHMISGLVEFRDALTSIERENFDQRGFITVITRGYAKTINIALSNEEEALMTLVSKQSCRRSGALFGEQGCDDSGEVCNYVESEVIIFSEKFCYAYVIVRGNVPSFWEVEQNFSKNAFLLPKNKKIDFTRSFEASSNAFERHFHGMIKHYGDVHIVDCLLQEKNSYKSQLSSNFKKHYEEYSRPKPNEFPDIDQGPPSLSKVIYSSIPLSSAYVKKSGYSAKNPTELTQSLRASMVDFGAFFHDSNKGIYIGKQLGVFRVNSLDSLAKANFVSKVISQEVMELALRDMSVPTTYEILRQHARLWSENDSVLKNLAYINPITASSLTASSGKRALKNHVAKRYLNVMRDPKASETAMLKLLGRQKDQLAVILYNPVHQYLNLQLAKRSQEFSSRKDISIFAATFNVNGSIAGENDLKHLIFSKNHPVNQDYDLVFIGFQEIVELTPGKMNSVKSENFMKWEKNLKSVLDVNAPAGEKYASLWSWQMGGIALLLFIKESQMKYISNVEGSAKKTGLGGMSANKGGLAVSFNYSKTLLCFVCSHLAAGHGNADERHQNYKTISKGMMFVKHKRVRDHDAILWLGDFNFRINLPIDRVKSLIESKEYQKLFEADQLNKQMASGESFPFYDEKEITFPPTYKFDNNSKIYDTSEKQRIPAWTDRILSLSKNKILKQEIYDSNEDIIFSDHRPVFAVFLASVEVLNNEKKRLIAHEVFESYTKVVGDINFLLTANDVTKYVVDLTDDVMPPPSSEASKWWLRSDALAKVNISELSKSSAEEQHSLVFNPGLAPNPFHAIDVPEFIKRNNVRDSPRIIS